jgi:polyisoprenoid-binding protein YceI
MRLKLYYTEQKGVDMKAIVMLLLSAVLGFAAELAVDKNASKLQFVATQMGLVKVDGSFSDFSGTVEVENGVIKEIDGEIVVVSIDTDNAKRDDHLRSSDFFYAVKYPTFTVKSMKINENSVEAEMKIKGITHTVNFAMERKKVTDEGVEIVLSGVVDRTLFDLDNSFMSAFMGNDIDVKAKIVAY